MKRLIVLVRQVAFGYLVKMRALSVGRDLKVNHYSRVSKSVSLGNNVNFNGMRISGEGNIRIGDNFHSGRGCSIIGSFHDFDQGDAVPYGLAKVDKTVTIEDNVWLGDQVIVLGGAHIGEGAVIQAGSVVVGRIPRCAVAGGHPAKPFKMRDVEHYEALKTQGRFF